MEPNTNKETAMSKVTITKGGKVGVLTLAADGRWDVTLDGVKAPGNYYMTTDEVKSMIAKEQAAGNSVVIE